MGVVLTVVGGMIFAIGALAFLVTLQNAMANAAATLICLVGAVFITGGLILDRMTNGIRQVIAAIRESKKS